MPNGLDFERQVHALLKKMGFEADVTKASGDGGIDIIAHSKEHITGGKYIIQCKDWSKPVGEPPVRDLYGVVTAEKANKGILITTSAFTSPAIKFAEGKPLELIDGTKFNQLLSKYGLAGIEGESHPAPDDERIKELTEKLNKNLKDILIMKELADIYLIKGIYDEAIKLYERLVPLKPSIEIVQLSRAYWDGINNYGVALAMQKRYDEAIKIFQRLHNGEHYMNFPIVDFTNEAYLVHYLGLFNIAVELYKQFKSKSIELVNNDTAWIDKSIGNAYMEGQLEDPYLVMSVSNAIERIGPELKDISLETAQQMAEKEGKKELYQTFFDTYGAIFHDFVEYWKELDYKITNDIFTTQSSDELKADIYNHVQLMNRCEKAVAEYSSIIAITIENPLQETYMQLGIAGLEVLKLIYEFLTKFNDKISNSQGCETWDEHKNLLSTFLLEGFSAIIERSKETDLNLSCIDDERKKMEEKWEDIINKEKTEWREKLCNTLYVNWSPKS